MNIRNATNGDIGALSQLLVAAQHAVYADILHIDDLNSLTESKARRQWKAAFRQNPPIFVAHNDNEYIQGYIWLGPAGDDDLNNDHTAEIYSLHVHPDCWRSGIGTMLCNYSFNILGEDHYVNLVVWMLAANLQARSFYEKLGFQHENISKDFKMKRQTYPLARYSRQLPAEPR